MSLNSVLRKWGMKCKTVLETIRLNKQYDNLGRDRVNLFLHQVLYKWKPNEFFRLADNLSIIEYEGFENN